MPQLTPSVCAPDVGLGDAVDAPAEPVLGVLATAGLLAPAGTGIGAPHARSTGASDPTTRSRSTRGPVARWARVRVIRLDVAPPPLREPV
ncbi:MAG: hypothetical protein ACRYG2_04840 [Janthinobacterium lividum]